MGRIFLTMIQSLEALKDWKLFTKLKIFFMMKTTVTKSKDKWQTGKTICKIWYKNIPNLKRTIQNQGKKTKKLLEKFAKHWQFIKIDIQKPIKHWFQPYLKSEKNKLKLHWDTTYL